MFPKTKAKTANQELSLDGIDEIAFKREVAGSLGEEDRVLQWYFLVAVTYWRLFIFEGDRIDE